MIFFSEALRKNEFEIYDIQTNSMSIDVVPAGIINSSDYYTRIMSVNDEVLVVNDGKIYRLELQGRLDIDNLINKTSF